MGTEAFWIPAITTAAGGMLNKPKKMDAPQQRSYLGEMQGALRAQGQIQGNLLDLDAQYAPQWQQQQQNMLMGQMGSMNALYGQAGQYSQGLQNAYVGMQAPINGQIGQAARNSYQQTLDPTTSGLYSTMASQAQQGLNNGTGLSAQETQLSQQSARAAMAARGMQFGNQGVAAEVLNSYNLGQNRQNQARTFAGQVYGAGQNNATQAMQMYGTPMMNQMNAISPSGLLGTAGQMAGTLGSKLFTPESQYNAGIYGANQQTQSQYDMGNLQAQAGWASGLTSALGSIGAGYSGRKTS